jgi:hypothetical protein
MGIESFWFVEIFAVFETRRDQQMSGGRSNILLLLETLNCYHGVIHFYMFVMTPSVLSTLKMKKACRRRSKKNLVENATNDGVNTTNTGDVLTESSSNTKESNLENSSQASKF